MMNALKRVFSLVLSCVLLAGALPAEGAVFRDSGRIVNRECVDILYILNIIHGKEDGSYFDPEGTVTRAELAKMICAALGGGTEPVLGDLPTSYPDTASHWAARYIEYCTVLGIVSGRGNGLFDPNAAVTGTEAAKMLLTAIGYSAAEEGYTGGAWAIAVNIRAGEKHLYAGLEHIVPSAPLTRDSAARMVCNALETGMVEYTYQLAIVNGVPVTVAKAKEIVPLRTILSHCYQAVTARGVLTGVSGDSLSISADSRAGSVSASFTRVGSDYSALLGQYVRVFFRLDGKVIGVVAAQ